VIIDGGSFEDDDGVAGSDVGEGFLPGLVFAGWSIADFDKLSKG
jgi:hypothetical protein